MTAQFPTPNYIDPETRGHGLVIVSTVLVVAAAAAVGLRFLSHCLYHRTGLDDICILLAWLMALGLIVTDDIVTSRYGWNRHIWDVPFEWIGMVGLYSWIAKIFYASASCFTRLSILSFYYRLTKDATWTRIFRIILHIVLVGVIILYLVTVFLAITLCSPIHAYWTFPRPMGSSCRSEARELFATSAANTVCDVLLVALPIPMIWRLKLSLRRRLAAITLLAVGLVAAAASCVRTYFVWNLFHSGPDTSWHAYPIYFASDVEIILGIICACTPHIKPLAKRYFSHPIPAR